jgi:hypothetical protein
MPPRSVDVWTGDQAPDGALLRAADEAGVTAAVPRLALNQRPVRTRRRQVEANNHRAPKRGSACQEVAAVQFGLVGGETIICGHCRSSRYA